MTIAFSCALIWLAAVDIPTGTELSYAGTLSHHAKSGTSEVKSFTVHAVTTKAEDGNTELAYFVDERGGWGWPERYGVTPVGSANPTKTRPIRILYTHDNQQHPISVRSLLFDFTDKLTPQATWSDGRFDYTVIKPRKVLDRPGLLVEAASNLGRSQSLVVDPTTGLVMSLEQKVILGRGDEFELKLELQSFQQVDGDALAKHQQAISSLRGIQDGLNRTGEQKIVELTSEQLEALRADLPRLQAESEGTLWSKLVATIERDLKQQQSRLEGVTGLKKRLVGQPAPELQLKLLSGSTVTNEDWKNKVVVLHFWQYRGEPLNEPYGQIGYLDFLYSKRKKLGANVIGINVDPRFADPKLAGAATRSMRSLLDFMKIGYEMSTDDGSTLSSFGDPRSLGTPLPLWIVIGHDGNVSHVHTGYYDIKPDEGLKQLDEAVIDALRRQKAQ